MYGRPRTHGFERPLSNDQLLSCVAFLVGILAYMLLVGCFLTGAKRVAVLSVHGIMLVVLVGSWLYIELTNPALPGGVSCWCLSASQSAIRYCGTCKKTVQGLDHHCVWLNTCIGKRNYFAFFSLVTTGFWMMLLQTIIGILMVTAWYPEVDTEAVSTLGKPAVYQTLIGLSTTLSVVLCLSMGALHFFHVYLTFIVRQGTYDWLMTRRNKRKTVVDVESDVDAKRQAEIERKREAERQEWSNRMRTQTKRSEERSSAALIYAKELELATPPSSTRVLESHNLLDVSYDDRSSSPELTAIVSQAVVSEGAPN